MFTVSEENTVKCFGGSSDIFRRQWSNLVYFQAMKPSAPLALYSVMKSRPTYFNTVKTVQNITEKKQY